MGCCCIKTLNLCKVPLCGSLTIDLPATAESGSGELNNYTLVLDFLQTQITLTEAQTEGENIHFDVSMLNENFEYTGQVFDPGGELVSIIYLAETYDCIKFKTVMNVSVGA